MIKYLAGFFLLLFYASSSFSQQGGEHIFQFLNLGSSARSVALGGEQVALGDPEPDLAFNNPALLEASMNQTTILNYVRYMADIRYGMASYTHHMNRWGTWSAAIHYVDYGKFTEANQAGKITGSFKAGEYAFLLTWSKKLSPNWQIGLNLKPIYSVLEKYHSWAIATDMGLRYQSNEQGLQMAIVARNIGLQLKPYEGTSQEPLPFEILMGYSQRLAHAPFRIAITYRHLEKFDSGGKTSPSQNTQEPTKNNLLKTGINHLVIGMEFLPSSNFTLRAGYNIQRRNDLSVEAKRSTVGLCWGFGIKIARFRLGYASARYHLAATTNHFSISTCLSDFHF